MIFEIAANVSGLIILIDDPESRIEIEKRADSYSLLISRGGVLKVRNLGILDGRTRLTTTLEGKTVDPGFLFFKQPEGVTIFEGNLSFDRSQGPDPGEKAMWKYLPSSIMNGVSTHAFYLGTLEEAKAALNEMRDELVTSTKEYGKKLLLSPEEFERRQRERESKR